LSEDWFAAAVRAVEAAADELREALDSVVGALREAAVERAAGLPVQIVVTHLVERGGRDARLAPTVAAERFEAAVTAYRARAIRSLVDEEGLSFTAIARLTGVSRQMVARLYRSSATSQLTDLT
jgi:hypothetical protein